MRVYVASSWRNERQPEVVAALREAGQEVYDFRTSGPGERGFSWRDVGLAPERTAPGAGDTVPADDYLAALRHPVARAGFDVDFAAMQWSEACVLVLPCGRSAHLELGWAVAAGRWTAILLDDPCVPELMYAAVDLVTPRLADIVSWVQQAPREDAMRRVLVPRS
ncbi:MAG: hypothetical protein FWF28_04050 [Micrococcales bacterium]|nr:hypothetical protein [Micrococcales bacterium]